MAPDELAYDVIHLEVVVARRDLHFRVTERQYEFLLGQARAADETLATHLRRLVHEEMQTTSGSNGTGSVPKGLRNSSPKRYKRASDLD